MMLDYHWYSRGKWFMDGGSLKMILQEKILIFKVVNCTTTQVKLKVIGVNTH